jgi:hypothetical protein
MEEKLCMDYDSMGDCGRFPINKKRKQPVTLKDRLIKLFKRKKKNG